MSSNLVVALCMALQGSKNSTLSGPCSNYHSSRLCGRGSKILVQVQI